MYGRAYPQDKDSEEDDKIPYSFSYAAARHFGGLPDREHTERRGPDGVTRGVFRYDLDKKYSYQKIFKDF